MGRKKKIITPPAEIEETKKVEESSDSSTKIGYKGNVNIKFIDAKTGKEKIIRKHNEGKDALFNFISKILAGNDIKNLLGYRPKKIQLYNVQGDIKTPLLIAPIPFDSMPRTYYNGNLSNLTNQVVYMFTIPGRSFVISLDINELSLLGENGEECASLTLDDDEFIPKISWNTNLVIEWILTITNVETNE